MPTDRWPSSPGRCRSAGPAVSRHLRVLKQAGMVTEEPVGTRRIYRLQAEGALAVQRYLEQVWGDAGTRFRLFAENTEPRPADD